MKKKRKEIITTQEFEDLCEFAAGYYGVPRSHMRFLSRKNQKLVRAKEMVVRLMDLRTPKLSHSEFGRWFGCTHATIIWMRKRIAGVVKRKSQRN